MQEPTITTAKPAKPTKPPLKEILHNYEEFKARIDLNKPIHHRKATMLTIQSLRPCLRICRLIMAK